MKASIASYTLAANVETLTFVGTGGFAGTGNTLNNVITGGVGNDTRCAAAVGSDTIYGSAGNDTVYGEGGIDLVICRRWHGQSLRRRSNDRLSGDAGDDWLLGEVTAIILRLDRQRPALTAAPTATT